MKQPAYLPYLLLLATTAMLLAFAWTMVATRDDSIPARATAELFPGGDTTVSIEPAALFILPAANLDAAQRPHFYAGKALAHQPWVKAPTTTDIRDGLGPLFNARTCLDCHVNGGRGHLPEHGDELRFTHIVRLSIPGEDAVYGVVPEPVYGDQLQAQSTALTHQLRGSVEASAQAGVAPEAYVYIDWLETEFRYPDGDKVSLRRPQLDIRQQGYGAFHADTLFSLRNAPPIHGSGLLQLIEARDIAANADPDDRDGDGISGRQNIVWDFESGKPATGRFGLKANKPSIRLQVAVALHADMGIASPVFPTQNCTPAQTACQRSEHGTDAHGFEISDQLLQLMTDFTMSLAVPERRKPEHPLVLAGRDLFYRTGCADCHHPDYTTGVAKAYPHLSLQNIWPYTDLLLHDMGEGLADGRPDYLASGSEWRTAPLWGVGLSQAVNGSQAYLHDGRARSVEEAVLWHGGEAGASQQAFVTLARDQRQALLAFVRTL